MPVGRPTRVPRLQPRESAGPTRLESLGTDRRAHRRRYRQNAHGRSCHAHRPTDAHPETSARRSCRICAAVEHRHVWHAEHLRCRPSTHSRVADRPTSEQVEITGTLAVAPVGKQGHLTAKERQSEELSRLAATLQLSTWPCGAASSRRSSVNCSCTLLLRATATGSSARERRLAPSSSWTWCGTVRSE